MRKHALKNTAITLALTLMTWAAFAQDAIPFQPDGAMDFSRTVVGHSERVTAQWVGMYNIRANWPAGVYKWWFNPSYIPQNMTADQVLATMQGASSRWGQMCNISFQYQGQTAVLPETKNGVFADGINVWGFKPFSAEMSSFAGWTPTSITSAFLGSPTGTITDADILLNPAMNWDQVGLDGALTHEIGHAIGIGHSDQTASIMSATPYHVASYNRWLRADDVAACTALYGEAPGQLVNRILNWAESAYPTQLKSGPAVTQGSQGYTYRYYPDSNSYAAGKDGHAFFMGPDGNILDLGPLGSYSDQALHAGY